MKIIAIDVCLVFGSLVLLLAPYALAQNGDPFLMGPSGVGVMRFGMTTQQLIAAWRFPDEIHDDPNQMRFFTYVLGSDRASAPWILLAFDKDKLAIITITDDVRFHTAEGAAIGLTRQEIISRMGVPLNVDESSNTVLRYRWIGFEIQEDTGRVFSIDVSPTEHCLVNWNDPGCS